MYIKGLIQAIRNMNVREYELFVSLGYEYHIKVVHNSKLKKAHFKIQLENFINGNTNKISFQNLDSYLYAFDGLLENGATKALYSQKTKDSPNNWRELFTKITTDIPLPKELNSSDLSAENIKEIKKTLQSLLLLCKDEDKEEIGRKIRVLNDFLAIVLKR